MLILYQLPTGPGWHPITHMVRLAAEMFSADLVVIDERRSPSRLQKLASLLPRRGTEPCLVVGPYPYSLGVLLLLDSWRSRFGPVVGWVIDSFWTDRLPRLGWRSGLFDHLFVTTGADVAEWKRMTGTPTSVLPWGADALRFGSSSPVRPVDLLRVGRQPPEWDDDGLSDVASREVGLRFAGRPRYSNDPRLAVPELMRRYAESKFVLAFSNLVNPARHTHPVHDYLTGRWVDALACGAVVAGVAPSAKDARELLWPGATLELGTTARTEGLRVIAEAVREWAPDRARLNRRRALERLDWRWRFEVIAKHLGVSPPGLASALGELQRAMRELDQDSGGVREMNR